MLQNLFTAIPWSGILTTIGTILWMVVKGLFVLAAGYFLTRWLVAFTGKCLKKSKLNETLHSFLLSCIRIVCYVFIIIMALTMLGIPTTSLITAIGTAWPSAWRSRTACPTSPAASSYSSTPPSRTATLWRSAARAAWCRRSA